MNDLKAQILHELSTGKASAITGTRLAVRLGMNDTRAIRLAIRELIADGIPVIGSNQGYYIADSIEDIDNCMKQLRAHLIEVAIRRRDLKHSRERLFTGQLSMSLRT